MYGIKFFGHRLVDHSLQHRSHAAISTHFFITRHESYHRRQCVLDEVEDFHNSAPYVTTLDGFRHLFFAACPPEAECLSAKTGSAGFFNFFPCPFLVLSFPPFADRLLSVASQASDRRIARIMRLRSATPPVSVGQGKLL